MMSPRAPELTDDPPGWFSDPNGAAGKRYWDGSAWIRSLTDEQRQVYAQGAVTDAVARGWRVESQTLGQAVIVRGNRPNHVLHLILTIITLGLWLIPWICVAIFGGEKRKTITITADARLLEA